ncbi:hypothetical protein N018_13240 [Pseudomonas syringae CC1557]|uniref:Uncharacterized protein n=1 Tax=Pseudomonas syringae CC1557 TaxID=1357279 RepID=W0MWC3_PSESX|nr:hypothetical protein [Pseudomonas syringae]AHG41121.1 hypothetical protein N018_13240 [Pseudomonas syringae CC1557]
MPIIPYSNYGNGDDEDKRIMAVNAALELIHARVSTSSVGGLLEGEMSRLSDYADQIQAAIKKQ